MKIIGTISLSLILLITAACEDPVNPVNNTKKEPGSIIHGEWNSIGILDKGAVYTFNFPNKNGSVTNADGTKYNIRLRVSTEGKYTFVFIYTRSVEGWGYTRFVLRVLNNDLIHLTSRGPLDPLDESPPGWTLVLQRKK